MWYWILSALVVVAFFVGVWLAPVVRGEYGEFKAYVEGKLHAAEQRAKDKAIGTINKL